ncbi:hypothetical protein PHLGIDRAFT_134988 [Phlebiopsis gigantea 11061_1 CR5-6]|uniref:Uncharacterized protein n=1 Tax=Phlebiopsis gigantea (strain 11061_1 CR5-6) TaxID=745531 RepID=A0A0C3SEI6_PHLG1|nr:hypothetical protein PHLGIDRAFT_134988 [Phlebiopsis gigantea 11061_1 CR5-6]
MYRRPLSFHAVSFGPHNSVLREMTRTAGATANRATTDTVRPVIESSYTEAENSVHLAEAFLGIAESLTKPRGGVIRV